MICSHSDNDNTNTNSNTKPTNLLYYINKYIFSFKLTKMFKYSLVEYQAKH